MSVANPPSGSGGDGGGNPKKRQLDDKGSQPPKKKAKTEGSLLDETAALTALIAGTGLDVQQRVDGINTILNPLIQSLNTNPIGPPGNMNTVEMMEIVRFLIEKMRLLYLQEQARGNAAVYLVTQRNNLTTLENNATFATLNNVQPLVRAYLNSLPANSTQAGIIASVNNINHQLELLPNAVCRTYLLAWANII